MLQMVLPRPCHREDVQPFGVCSLIFLDTPSVAHASHRFYERAGFRKIDAGQLPVAYSYPDRDSLLYLLDL